MRKGLVITVGVVLLLVGIAKGSVRALEGVGALADQLSNQGSVEMKGKTAPWSEVVVVDPGNDDEVLAVAEIEPSGEYRFSFRASSLVINRAEIFGVDTLGLTNRVGVYASLGKEILLPPTIVNDLSDTGTTNAALRGYTYPNSSVEISFLGETGYEDSEIVLADATGAWSINREDLPTDKYTATARATNGALVSELSQEIYFEILAVSIPTEVTRVIETVAQVVDLIPGGKQIREFIQNNPEVVTAVVVPVATVTVVSGLVIKDLIAILLKLFLGLLHLLGWKKGRKSWGVTYGAVKKNPLSRVIVRLYGQDGQLVETDVTGNDGVFAFLPQAGEYKMVAVKAGYDFPSKLVRGSGSDGEYDRLYHGEVLKLGLDSGVNVSIPLDPEEVEVGRWFYIKRMLGVVWNVFGWVVLLLGLYLATESLLRKVSVLNVVVVLFYIGLIVWGLLKYRKGKAEWASVVDVATSKGVAGVEVDLYDVEFGRLVQRRVSDDKGRFLMVVPKGVYKMSVNSDVWVLDVETKKRGFMGEQIVVKRDNQALGLKIWVRRKA